MSACATGNYCNANKCTANIASGAACDAATTGCEFGTSCVETIVGAEAAKKNCEPWFSIADGTQVTYLGGMDVTLWHFCKSAQTFTKDDKTYCVTASTTKEDVTAASDTCTVVEFVDETDFTKSSEKANTGKCGFNQDDKKYCPS